MTWTASPSGEYDPLLCSDQPSASSALICASNSGPGFPMMLLYFVLVNCILILLLHHFRFESDTDIDSTLSCYFFLELWVVQHTGCKHGLGDRHLTGFLGPFVVGLVKHARPHTCLRGGKTF